MTTPTFTVDWTGRFQLITDIVAADLPEQERFRLIDRVEQGISAALQRGGTPAESAVTLAFSYVFRCVGIASSARRA